jgi:transmembrane sensor
MRGGRLYLYIPQRLAGTIHMNKNDRFTQLLELYISGNISTDEHDELFGLLSTHKYDGLLGLSLQNDLAGDSGSKTADLPPHIAEEIVRNIFNAEKNTAKVLPIKRSFLYKWHWIAASAVIAIAITGFLLLSGNKTREMQLSFSALIPDTMINKINTTGKQEVIILNDGSSVTLQPNSKLHYARQFAPDKREVFLEGEAFFQVAKNPAKPFFVYYNNIVTKVLGTSFTVNTNVQTGNVEVAVKTGKVQVYENEKLVKISSKKAVILTPNQKVIYMPADHLFETALVEKPQPLIDENEKEEVPVPFVYDQEKLQNVFKHLEANYGIEIILENTNLNNCVFTGDVSVQDLYTKLKIICLTTNASYEINGTKILIKGKGCD